VIAVQQDATGYSAPSYRLGVDWQFLYAYVGPTLIGLMTVDPVFAGDEIDPAGLHMAIYFLLGAEIGLVIALVRWMMKW